MAPNSRWPPRIAVVIENVRYDGHQIYKRGKKKE
jgi:hypothetical protein